MAGTGLRERVLIGELWQMGMKDCQIAERLGLRQRTVRKWRQKWSRYGRVGVVSQMGRPKQGALCSFPAEIVDQLKEWREAHPGWGPKTLWAELVRHPAWDGEPLPSRASIGRWLRQAGKTRPYQKQPRLPQVLSPTQACHEEWEMDARGHEHIDGVGLVSLIQVNDLFSRVKLISYPCLVGQTHLERYPATPDYQLVLRRAFVEWGLPDRLAVDRAHVFLDVQGSTPFPTPLHLWLLGLGVQLTFGRPNQPRDQAVTERSHQTWWAQVVVGQHFSGLDGLWQALERRRSFLNEDLPCHSLGEQPPLIAFPQVRQPRRRYRPEWEEDLLDLERIYHFLS